MDQSVILVELRPYSQISHATKQEKHATKKEKGYHSTGNDIGHCFAMSTIETTQIFRRFLKKG
ncbi:hypothetical protein PsorP6_001539 [Peronosclerospora sorghi]|uniref:Uncharacterized protein n=1 Tax=Peronosclerospora sorghi TaxID=230839 RepID=A0ACC0WUZ5_9STRA|nr:hypothetical protein PsorP6_001539 [Peronosclerospora sorghi]